MGYKLTWMYIWQQKIRPKGWKPWVNTIAYYPLDSTNTVDDLSWNNLTLTGWWTYQFWTYGWVDCCSISNGYFTANHSWSWDITILAWCNQQWQPANDTGVIAMTYDTGHPVSQIWYNKESNRPNYDPDGWIYGYAERWGLDYTTNYHNSTNQWYLVACTRDWSSINLYINWVLEKTWTISSWTWAYSQLGVSRDIRSMVWYVSNVIFEDKIRTAQEISDYYNQTKWNYWIS